MMSCRTETDNRNSELNAENLTSRLLLQPSVSGVAVSVLVSGLTVDILAHFMVFSRLVILVNANFFSLGFYCLTVLFIAKM